MNDFEKVYAEQQGIKPTLRDVLRVALAARRDRLSMVREATADREPGVAVVMIGEAAIRDLGPVLIAHAKCVEHACGVATSAPKDRVSINGGSDMATLFQWVDQRQPQWGWIPTDIDGTKVLIYLSTACVTDKLAELLTQRGCITRLK